MYGTKYFIAILLKRIKFLIYYYKTIIAFWNQPRTAPYISDSPFIIKFNMGVEHQKYFFFKV